MVRVCVYACVRVCVCVWERERVRKSVCLCACEMRWDETRRLLGRLVVRKKRRRNIPDKNEGKEEHNTFDIPSLLRFPTWDGVLDTMNANNTHWRHKKIDKEEFLVLFLYNSKSCLWSGMLASSPPSACNKSSKESVGTVGIIIPGTIFWITMLALGQKVCRTHTIAINAMSCLVMCWRWHILCRPIETETASMTAYLLTPEIQTGW